MAILQSKRKMQQSLFIQEDNESSVTIIYRCMASPKKQMMLWAKGMSLKIAVTNADICMAELSPWEGKRERKEKLCRKNNTGKAAESLRASENSCWENFP